MELQSPRLIEPKLKELGQMSRSGHWPKCPDRDICLVRMSQSGLRNLAKSRAQMSRSGHWTKCPDRDICLVQMSQSGLRNLAKSRAKMSQRTELTKLPSAQSEKNIIKKNHTTQPNSWMACLADKTNHPVERLSLNRSQCGSCSTKYDTSAGT